MRSSGALPPPLTRKSVLFSSRHQRWHHLSFCVQFESTLIGTRLGDYRAFPDFGLPITLGKKGRLRQENGASGTARLA
jgi:hypothetical protein